MPEEAVTADSDRSIENEHRAASAGGTPGGELLARIDIEARIFLPMATHSRTGNRSRVLEPRLWETWKTNESRQEFVSDCEARRANRKGRPFENVSTSSA